MTSFLKIPLLCLGVILAGCDARVTSVSGSGPGSSTTGPANEKASMVVSILTFDEYIDPALTKEFTERTGIAVDQKFYTETDEMVERLKSNPGDHDIFICEDGYIPILGEKRVIKTLDHSKLPHWKNLDPDRINQPFDPKNELTVPYLWGTTLLAYRKDLLKDPKHSWSLIFDSALKDKVCFMNERMETYAAVLRSMKVNLEDANGDDLSKAADSIVNLVRDHGLRMGGEKDVKQYLLEGSSLVSMMYSGDAAKLAEENPDVPLGYFIPDEGATVWTDSFCISQDSMRIENAYKFLDFMLEAKSAAASTNFAHYASPNLAARPFIDAELLADETIHPRPEVLAKCRYFKLRDLESQRLVNAGWRRVQESLQVTSNEEPEPPAPDATVTLEEKVTAPN